MQDWPDITHAIIAAIGSAELKSASSSTMWADLPPNSSSVFFTVGAPAARIARPVAVDPVNVIMSTRGSADSAAPTSLALDTTTLNTPGGDVGLLGDDAAVLTARPRGELSGLEHDGVARHQRGHGLGDVEVERHVPRRDRADHADGLVVDLAPRRAQLGRVHAGVDEVLEGLAVLGPVLDLLDRALDLAAATP